MNTKKIILSSLLVLGITIAATAQDRITVHLKNGTTKTFSNGMYSTSINTWGKPAGQPLDNSKLGLSEPYIRTNDFYGTTSGLTIENKKVYATFYCENLSPTAYQSGTELLLSTKPGITAKNAEMTFVSYSGSPFAFFIGKDIQKSHFANYGYGLYDYELIPGQTYYYRIGTGINYEHDGEQQNTITMGQERWFRAPNYMYMADLIPDELLGDDVCLPSSKAWSEFCQQHFQDPTKAPSILQLDQIWTKWIATAGKDAVLQGEHLNFDDGKLFLVSLVPEAFFQWASSRELVVNSPDQVVLPTIINPSGDTIVTVADSLIEQVDAKWQLPQNRYMQFVPTTGTINPTITFNFPEAIPGIAYKLHVVFAPEVAHADNADNAHFFLPTIVRINCSNSKSPVESETEIGYDATTVKDYDLGTLNSNTSIEIITRVRSAAYQNGTHNRVLRISEVRLIPVGTDEKS